MIGLLEFYKLVSAKQIFPQKVTGIILGCIIYLLILLTARGILPKWSPVALFPLLFIFFIVELFRKMPEPMNNLAYGILSIIYIAVPLSLLNFFFDPVLNAAGNHPAILAGFLALVWVNDIFAYLTGILIGRHKLYERISPKKTWEGAVGGFIFTLISGWTLSLFIHDLTMDNWLVIAFIVVIFGTFGDLSESLVKRKFNIKDTGNLLPGHGGILDRFDALFFAAPSVYVYLLIIMA